MLLGVTVELSFSGWNCCSSLRSSSSSKCSPRLLHLPPLISIISSLFHRFAFRTSSRSADKSQSFLLPYNGNRTAREHVLLYVAFIVLTVCTNNRRIQRRPPPHQTPPQGMHSKHRRQNKNQCMRKTDKRTYPIHNKHKKASQIGPTPKKVWLNESKCNPFTGLGLNHTCKLTMWSTWLPRKDFFPACRFRGGIKTGKSGCGDWAWCGDSCGRTGTSPLWPTMAYNFNLY